MLDAHTRFGVPQWPILGPKLFTHEIIYYNRKILDELIKSNILREFFYLFPITSSKNIIHRTIDDVKMLLLQRES